MGKMKFATAINCMDGRVQIPVIKWIKKKYVVDYIDMITEPGPNKILADSKDNLAEAIKRKCEISINRHNSKLIAIIGHHDCAGNPAPKNIQFKHITDAMNTIKSWNLGVKVIGLWVNEKWKVEEVNKKLCIMDYNTTSV